MHWSSRRLDWLAALGLVLASFLFNVDQVSEHDRMSPIDEYQYIDYYAKVADHGIVRRGEPMGLYARKYMMCNGVRVLDYPPNPDGCAKPNSVGYPLEGGTTADLYSPLYFWTTRALAQPLVFAGVDLVDAGRYVGSVWLAAAATVMYFALRRLGASRLPAFALSLLMVGSLPAYWATTYISTDASALLSGATALALTMAAISGVGGKRPLILLPLLSMVAVWLKLQNFMGFVVGALCLVLVAAWAARSQPTLRSRLKATFRDKRAIAGIATIAAGFVAQVLWLVVRGSLAVGPQPQFGFAVDFKPSALWFELSNFLPRIAMGAVDPGLTGQPTQVVYMVGTAVMVGGIVGLTVARGVPSIHRIVGMSTLAVALIAAPALAISVALVEHNYAILPWRYGMSLIPWAIACFGLLADFDKRWARWLITAVALAVWALAVMAVESP